MDKYFVYDSFEGFPKFVNVRDHTKYIAGGAETAPKESLNQLRSIH